MPTIEQYLPWVASGPAFVWTTDPIAAGSWMVAIHGLSGGTLTDMKPEDPAHLEAGAATRWQLLAQIDAGVGAPKWRVWARKVVAAGTYQAGFPGPDAGLDIYSHLLVISGCRDADDASDVFTVGAATSATAGTSQAVPQYNPDDIGTNLVFAAWLSGAVTNYTLPGTLSANAELDGAASTSRSGQATETGHGTGTFTATAAAGAPWAAVTLLARAASAGSVTFPATPLRMRTELALGANPGQDPAFWAGLWTDITADAQPRDGGVSITRGRTDETSTVAPSSMTLTLSDTAGTFVRQNPLSPYYGQLSKNQPIQLWVDYGAGWVRRYCGYIAEWPPRSQGGQVDEHMPITAAGPTRRLARGRALSSALYRMIIGRSVQAYYPLETSLTPAIGSSKMRVTSGGFTFGEGGPPGSAGAVSTASGGGVATAAVVGMPDVDGWTVSWWLTIPDDFDTAADTSMVVTWSTPGSRLDRWLCYMNPSSPGDIIIGAFTIGDSAAASASAALTPGSYLITALAQPNGADVSFGVQVTDLDGVGLAQTGGSITADQVTPVTAVGLNASADLVGSDLKGSISHLMVAADPHPTSGDLWGSGPATLALAVAGSGYAGERATDRIRRLGGEENVPVVIVGDDGASEPMGPQPLARFLDMLRDVEATDGGVLHETRDGRLAYQARAGRYNATPSAALDYASGHVALGLEPTDDDQHIVNSYEASRDGGEAVAVIDSAHIDEVGEYAQSGTVNVADDDQLADQAGWRVHLGTADGLRYPVISPNLNGKPSIIPDWAAADVGQLVQMTNPGRDLPPGTAALFIEGYTEVLDTTSWTASVNASPGEPWTVAVLDDAVLGAADTAGSALNSSATSTAASISVKTTSGPLWTTASGDRPFNITVGGEVMTVTNVTGSSSPQTFTVTRSVNGVVKAHVANEDVRLATPPILSF